MENVDNVTTSNTNIKTSIVKERLKLFDRSHTDNSYENLEQTSILADTVENPVSNDITQRKHRSARKSELSIYIPTAYSSGYFSSTPDSTSTQSVFDDTRIIRSSLLEEKVNNEGDLEICEPHSDNMIGRIDHNSTKKTSGDEEFETRKNYLTEELKDNEIAASCKNNETFLYTVGRAKSNTSKELKERYNNLQEGLRRNDLNDKDQSADITHSAITINDDTPPRHENIPPPLPPKSAYKTKFKIPTFPEGKHFVKVFYKIQYLVMHII